MTDNIMIGASYATRAYVSTFFDDSRDREPRCSTIDYSERIDAGDGTRPAVGWLSQKWMFGRLTESYWDDLMAFRDTAVYVRTRKNDGTYGYYTAILIGPDEEPEHYAGRVISAEITFRAMVLQVAPTPSASPSSSPSASPSTSPSSPP